MKVAGYNNYKYKGLVILVWLTLLSALPGFEAGVQAQTIDISAEDLNNEQRIIFITDYWKFHPGDDSRWADPSYDDSDWEYVSTYLSESDLAFTNWEGMGWFRLHLNIDSTLVNIPLALLVQNHNGASEIYLNGEKSFGLGTFSTMPDQAENYFGNQPRPLIFSSPGEHLLAVRYANFESDRFLEMKSFAGFRFLFGELDYHILNHVSQYNHTGFWPIFFLGSLLVFTVIHALLYWFNRNEYKNLYFSAFTFLLAFLISLIFVLQFTSSPLDSMLFYKLSQVIWVIAMLLALRFVYSLYHPGHQIPAYFWLFILGGVVIGLLSWFDVNSYSIIRELFILATVLELIRVLILIFLKKERGAWIIGGGMLVFAVSIIYRVSINIELFEGDPVAISFAGAGCMIFAMSVFLSKDFAFTQISLAEKLKEVKQWSEKAIEQEKLNKQIELETKLLEAENNRKSRELEEARALQLSMLPRNLPDLPNLSIAVWMETAQEVGGDYYDYHLEKNGCPTFVIGDATGHGLKAGIMVATAKSYFHTLAGEFENRSILEKMSSGFRNLDLKLMFMGILLMRWTGYTFSMMSAGMPPVLWYRKKKNETETLILKGLPLGTRIQYDYDSIEAETEPGDLLLLMSDGLFELFNENREQLGMHRIKEFFESNADLAPADIINQFKVLVSQWAGQNKNEDDITLMVIKVK